MIYLATWFEVSEIMALAKKRGMTEDNDLFDFVEPEIENLTKCRRFPNKGLAVAFLQREIIDKGRDLWGQCEVIVMDKVQHRCRYCTCRGEQAVSRFWVDDEEAHSEETCNSECYDGDD